MREYAQQYLTSASPQRINENSIYTNTSGQEQSLANNRIIQRL